MKKTKLFLLLIFLILLISAAFLLFFNSQSNKSQIENTKEYDLKITAGKKDFSLSREDILKMPLEEFYAEYLSSSHDDEKGTYEGISIQELFEIQSINIEDFTSLTAKATDGYQTTYTSSEIKSGNVFLIVKKNGKPLDEANGPFLTVLKNYPFGNRNVKSVSSLSLK